MIFCFSWFCGLAGSFCGFLPGLTHVTVFSWWLLSAKVAGIFGPFYLSLSLSLFFFFFCFFCFRVTPMAYGGSQARGPIGAVVTGLCHSHSNARFKSHLWPKPQLMAMPDPNSVSKARDWTRILMVTSQIHFCWATMGTSWTSFSL